MYLITILNPNLPARILTESKLPTMERIQEWVLGDFQVVPDFKKYKGKTVVWAYANEYGREKNMPPNRLATLAWREYLDSTKRPYHPEKATLVGPVVIVQKEK